MRSCGRWPTRRSGTAGTSTILQRPDRSRISRSSRLARRRAACISHSCRTGCRGLPTTAFELIGRLPRSESFVLVGRNADEIRKVQDLRGKRIGIGPAGSGTEYVARSVLTQLTGLDIKASTHSLVEQLCKDRKRRARPRGHGDRHGCAAAGRGGARSQPSGRRHARRGGAREPPAVLPCWSHRSGPLRSDTPASVDGQAGHPDRHARHRQWLRARVRYARRHYRAHVRVPRLRARESGAARTSPACHLRQPRAVTTTMADPIR